MSSEARMEDANEHKEQEKQKQQGFLMKSIEQWTTLVFLISQGSGILATCLFQLDWQFRGSEIIATIMWVFTILVFAIFSLIYIAKICLFPKTVRKELTSNIMELCCLFSPVITFGVIINMVALVCAKAWGPSWGMVAYVLNWINIFLSFVAAVGIPYVYFRCCPPGVDSTPPGVILPAIAALTASSACGIVCFNGKLQARTQGVFALGAIELGKELNSPAFNALSSGLVVLTVCIWLANILFTLKLAFHKISQGKQHQN
ncbi:MAG: hypothetical protein Q9201_002062 [Fulgogasparrea decipioides]